MHRKTIDRQHLHIIAGIHNCQTNVAETQRLGINRMTKYLFNLLFVYNCYMCSVNCLLVQKPYLQLVLTWVFNMKPSNGTVVKQVSRFRDVKKRSR